jgi:hypothetical protein
MKSKLSVKLSGMLFAAMFVFGSCKENKEPEPPKAPSAYSLGVQVGAVNYILPTDNIKEGSVSPVGNGVEVPGNEFIQSGNYFYFFSRAEKKFYQYEVKSNGTVEEKGALLITSYVTDRAYSQSLIDDNTILIIDPLKWGEPAVKWLTVSIPDFKVKASGSLNLPVFEQAPGVNWRVNVGKVVLHGSKLVMGSVYYDLAGNYAPGTHVVTFDYPSMANPTKVTSTKSTGEIGYTNQLFTRTANGDLYVGAYRGPYGPPSNDAVFGYILKIPNGQHTFDANYFFDLSKKLNEPTQVMLFNTNDMPTYGDLDKENYYFARIDLAAQTISKFNLPKSSVRLGRYPLVSNGKYITFHKSLANNKTNVVEIDYNGGPNAYTIGKQILGDGVNGISVVAHPAQ